MATTHVHSPATHWEPGSRALKDAARDTLAAQGVQWTDLRETVFDALAEHGDTLVSEARDKWPVFSGASRDGLHAVTVITTEGVRLRVSNDATKKDQTAYLRGAKEPVNKSRGHYIVWQQAQTKPKATADEYGYLIGGRPSTWKLLVLDTVSKYMLCRLDTNTFGIVVYIVLPMI